MFLEAGSPRTSNYVYKNYALGDRYACDGVLRGLEPFIHLRLVFNWLSSLLHERARDRGEGTNTPSYRSNTIWRGIL